MVLTALSSFCVALQAWGVTKYSIDCRKMERDAQVNTEPAHARARRPWRDCNARIECVPMCAVLSDVLMLGTTALGVCATQEGMFAPSRSPAASWVEPFVWGPAGE
jgi:hypothetical protein